MSQFSFEDFSDSIIFDLDGTLWDASSSSAISWNNVLRRHGIDFRKIEPKDIRRVTGLSHEQCIRIVFEGLAEKEISVLILETQNEDNRVIAERGGHIYPGVEIGLRQLSEVYPLFIVSNCQSGYIENFLRLAGFYTFFKDFECWGNTGLLKPENIRMVVERNSLKRPFYIGDTEADRNAADVAQVPFAFVEYGFGKSPASNIKFPDFNSLKTAFLSLAKEKASVME